MPLSCAACCREARLEELEIDIQSCAGPALLHAIILSPSLAPLPLSVCVMVLVGRSEFKFAEICQRGPGRYDTRRTIGGQADNDPLLTDEPSWLPLVREILGNDCVPLWQGVVSPPMLPPLGTDSARGGGGGVVTTWSPRPPRPPRQVLAKSGCEAQADHAGWSMQCLVLLPIRVTARSPPPSTRGCA